MKKTITSLICTLCCLFLLSSCLTTRQTNLLVDDGQHSKKINETEALEEYRICSGDELKITVATLNQETNALFSMFSMNSGGASGSSLSSFTVYPDGNIDFPYLGSIYVKGKTTLEVKLLMEEKLKTMIGEGAVLVSLDNRYFSVIGEGSVGRYAIVKEKTTIFQALAQSSDIRPYGDRSKVKIVRQTATGSIEKVFDVKSVDIVNSEFYYIQPNDVIYIQPMARQFWGMDSFGAVFAVFSTVISTGFMIYSFVK